MPFWRQGEARGLSLQREGGREEVFWTDLELRGQNVLFCMVNRENERQVAKWGIQSHRPSEWVLFTTEELGELAKAVGEHQYRDGDSTEIVKEAIQVATLSLKIAEMAMKEAEKT